MQGSVDKVWKGGHVRKAPWRGGMEPEVGSKEMWNSGIKMLNLTLVFFYITIMVCICQI